MGAIRSVVDNVFRSKSTVDLQTVSAKLADATAALRALEQERQERALDAALADDPAALLDIESRLAAARSRAESLELAAGEAQRRENARLAEARNAARRSQLNGLRQHVAAAAKEADRITAGLDMAVAGYRELLKTALKIEKGLSGDERRFLYADGSVPILVQKMVALELARIGSAIPNSLPAGSLDFPGADRRGHNLPHGTNVNEALPLADLVRQRFDINAIAAGFEVRGSFAPLKTPQPPSEAEWKAAVADREAVARGEPDPEPAGEQPVELSAEDVALLTAAQTAGAETSSVRLADNWHDAKERHDAAR